MFIKRRFMHANGICAVLLDNISSYSGSKKLRLEPCSFKTQDESCAAANHLPLGERVSVTVEFKGGWCFGDRALMVISEYRKLKILQVPKSCADSAVVSRCVFLGNES